MNRKEAHCDFCNTPVAFSGTDTTVLCPTCNIELHVLPDGSATSEWVSPLSDHELDTLLRKEIAAGRTVNAIEIFQRERSTSLADAFEYIKEMRRRLEAEGESLTDDSPGLAHVKSLGKKGQTVEAIKWYRFLTNAGLKEAKDAVKAMISDRPPDENQAGSQDHAKSSRGCLDRAALSLLAFLLTLLIGLTLLG